MTGSSVNFKAVKSASHAVSHARTAPPTYLLPNDKSLGTVVLMDDAGDVASVLEAKMAKASRQALREKNYSPVWEGILNLRRPEPGEDGQKYKHECCSIVQDWCDKYEASTGHKVLRVDVHLDEGHMVGGEALLNAHAHVIADRTNKLGRVMKLSPKQLRELQTLTAKVTGLERGESSLKTGRKHISHHAYKHLAEQGRLETQQVAGELEKAKGQAEFYGRLIDTRETQGQKKAQQLKDAKAEVSKKDAELTQLKASGEAIQGDYVALKKAHEVALARLTSAEAQAAKVPGLEEQAQKATRQAIEAQTLMAQYQRDRDALKASGEAIQGDYVALKKAHEVALARLTSAEAQAAKVPGLEEQAQKATRQAIEAQTLMAQYQRDRDALKVSGEATQGDYVALKKAHEVALARLTSAEAQAAKVPGLEEQAQKATRQAIEAQTLMAQYQRDRDALKASGEATQAQLQAQIDQFKSQAQREAARRAPDTTGINPLSRYHPDNIAKREAQERDLAAAAILQSNKTREAVPLTPSPSSPLANQLQESLDAMAEWIRAIGGQQEAVKPSNQYFGPVKHMDRLHCVQKTGRNNYTVHRLDDLDKLPALDDSRMEIKYRNGVGQVVGKFGQVIER